MTYTTTSNGAATVLTSTQTFTTSSTVTYTTAVSFFFFSRSRRWQHHVLTLQVPLTPTVAGATTTYGVETGVETGTAPTAVATAGAHHNGAPAVLGLLAGIAGLVALV